MDQENSEYGHFSRSELQCNKHTTAYLICDTRLIHHSELLFIPYFLLSEIRSFHVRFFISHMCSEWILTLKTSKGKEVLSRNKRDN